VVLRMPAPPVKNKVSANKTGATRDQNSRGQVR
jgi:hypothetical protein